MAKQQKEEQQQAALYFEKCHVRDARCLYSIVRVRVDTKQFLIVEQ